MPLKTLPLTPHPRPVTPSPCNGFNDLNGFDGFPGMVVLLDSFESTQGLPPFVKTVSASAAAALWRIGLMPIGSFKTTLQVWVSFRYTFKTALRVWGSVSHANRLF